jgi:hypothetical protein
LQLYLFEVFFWAYCSRLCECKGSQRWNKKKPPSKSCDSLNFPISIHFVSRSFTFRNKLFPNPKSFKILEKIRYKRFRLPTFCWGLLPLNTNQAKMFLRQFYSFTITLLVLSQHLRIGWRKFLAMTKLPDLYSVQYIQYRNKIFAKIFFSWFLF